MRKVPCALVTAPTVAPVPAIVTCTPCRGRLFPAAVIVPSIVPVACAATAFGIANAATARSARRILAVIRTDILCCLRLGFAMQVGIAYGTAFWVGYAA